MYGPQQPYQMSAYRLTRHGGRNRQEKYHEYVPLEDFQTQPDSRLPPSAHSSSEPNTEKRTHLSKRMKELKFEDEYDLLAENFETGFDDDLEAILGADFVGMVTILLAEFEEKTEAQGNSEDCFDIFPGQECFFFGSDDDEGGLFERPDELMKSHLQLLHIKADIAGKMVNQVLVDGGAAINLLPESMLAKFGKIVDQLVKANVVVAKFTSKTSISKLRG